MQKRQGLERDVSQAKSDDGNYEESGRDLKSMQVEVETEVTAVDRDLNLIMSTFNLVQSRYKTAMDNFEQRQRQLRWIEFQIGEYRKCVRVIAVSKNKDINERAVIVGQRLYPLTQVVDSFDIDVVKCLVETAASGRSVAIGFYGLLVKDVVDTIYQIYQHALSGDKVAAKSLEQWNPISGLSYLLKAEGAGRLHLFEVSLVANLKSLAMEITLAVVAKIDDGISTTMLNQLTDLAVTPNIV